MELNKKGLSSGHDDSWNLEDYMMDLFHQKKTESPEFKIMLQIYGREKIKGIFEKWVMMKNAKKPSQS